MSFSFLDLVYPKSCHICGKCGQYLCDTCKKTFKRNLPECYICRRISPNFNTHVQCRDIYSLDRVVIGWEYNGVSSRILKDYKYRGAWDIAGYLSEFFIHSIGYIDFGNTLFTSVPISFIRRGERGFNQTELLVEAVSRCYGCNFSLDLLGRRVEKGHQSLRDRQERLEIDNSNFYIRDSSILNRYSSVTVLDDVITTGKTLESISKIIKKEKGEEYLVNALCLFRGKPYYS